MKLELATKSLFAAILAVLLSGCVTHRTVTSGGETISSGYVIKHPIRDALSNSQ